MKGPLRNHYLSEWRLEAAEARNDSQANGYLAERDEFWLNFPEMNNLPFKTIVHAYGFQWTLNAQ